MGSKIPFKHGAKPIEVFDLDDRGVRVNLGIEPFIDPAQPPKRADRYVRYSDGKFGVLESKSSTLRKAPEQLRVTADLFLRAGKQVDYLIVVLEDLSSYERENFYKIKNGLLFKASDGKPYVVNNGSHHWDIEIFREKEVSIMNHSNNKFFGGS